MVEPAKKVRGRPFKKKGDEWSDAARVGSVSDTSGGEVQQDVAPEAFAEFARGLLTDAAVRKAFVKRWKRGEFSAAELKMMTDAAATAPERTDRQRQYREELPRLARLSRGERQLLHRLTRKMAGEEIDSTVPGYAWTLTRRPGSAAAADLRYTLAHCEPDEPAPEPELSDVLPLAEASGRLKALAPRRDEAIEVDVDVIPTPEQALRALTGPRAEPAHDVDDERHRSACRACRLAWRDRP